MTIPADVLAHGGEVIEYARFPLMAFADIGVCPRTSAFEWKADVAVPALMTKRFISTRA